MQEQEGLPVVEQGPRDNVVTGPGQELAKHRVRVSFDFDITCDSGPVASESYDEGGTMDTALLKSFLVADKGKLLDMMVDAIGQKLGMHSCETFMLEFLPQVSTNSHKLFESAIDALEGDEKQYWRDAAEPSCLDNPLEDYLELSTESIFECFNAEFVSSGYQVVEDKPEVVVIHNYIDSEAIKDTSQLRVKKGESNA